MITWGSSWEWFKSLLPCIHMSKLQKAPDFQIEISLTLSIAVTWRINRYFMTHPWGTYINGKSCKCQDLALQLRIFEGIRLVIYSTMKWSLAIFLYRHICTHTHTYTNGCNIGTPLVRNAACVHQEGSIKTKQTLFITFKNIYLYVSFLKIACLGRRVIIMEIAWGIVLEVILCSKLTLGECLLKTNEIPFKHIV